MNLIARSPSLRMILASLLALSWTGAVHALAAADAPGAAGGEPLAHLRRAAELARAELSQLGADPSDVGERAASLGRDPSKLMAFVRDEVAYEPYRGILRGARGALSARAGNAYDQCLLLHAMLEACGHKARLVKGKLPAEHASKLVAQFLARAPLAGPLADFVPAEADFQVSADDAARAGMEQAELQKLVAENRAASDAALTEASDATARQAEFLAGQLQQAGVTLGRPHAEWVKELEGRAAEHVWVEWTTSDGKKVALDPTIADAPVGSTPGTNGRPVSPKEMAADRHVVRFSVTYRHGDETKPKEVKLLDVPLAAERGLFDPVEFSIVPAAPLPPTEELLKMSPEEAIKFWTGFPHYQAVLSVASRRHGSKAFDLKGKVFEITADGRVGGAADVGKTTGGMLGGGFGGIAGEDAEETPGGQFVDLSVLMTIESPGEHPTRHHRTLLTRADVNKEHFLSPIVSWQMLIQPQVVSARLAAHGTLQHVVDTLTPILPVADKGGADGAAAVERLMTQPKRAPHPSLLVDMAQLRQAGMSRAAGAEGAPAAPLWDRPQVTIAERRFCAMLDGSHACGRFAIDIVTNAMSFVPRAAGAEAAAATAALRQGVFDTAVEDLIVRRAGLDNGSYHSAIAKSEELREAGVPMRVVAPRDAQQLAGVALSDVDRAWVQGYEPDDRRVLAPQGGEGGTAADVPSVWWSLDPATGSILGRREGGRGQSAVEYIAQVLAGGICMAFYLINAELDEAAAPDGYLTGPQNEAVIIMLLGCAVSSMAGIGGIGLAGLKAGSIVVVNAIVIGAFNLWAGAKVRNPAPK